MRLRGLMRKEFLQIMRDPSSIGIAFLMPLVLLLLFGYGVSLDSENIPVALVVEQPSADTASFTASFHESRYSSHRFNDLPGGGGDDGRRANAIVVLRQVPPPLGGTARRSSSSSTGRRQYRPHHFRLRGRGGGPGCSSGAAARATLDAPVVCSSAWFNSD
jgi:ABC-2 type transport system permease protein